MPSTPPAPSKWARRPRPRARAKPRPRPRPGKARGGFDLSRAAYARTLSHAKPGCSRVWPLHNRSKSETSDVDVGEGGEASEAKPSRVRGCSFKQTCTPHPVLAFGSDHPLPRPSNMTQGTSDSRPSPRPRPYASRGNESYKGKSARGEASRHLDRECRPGKLLRLA